MSVREPCPFLELDGLFCVAGKVIPIVDVVRAATGLHEGSARVQILASAPGPIH